MGAHCSNQIHSFFQESLFYRPFLQGQQEMWFELIRRWSNEVDNLLQKLRNLQLISKDNVS